MSHDVVIVGGGVMGSSVAYHLLAAQSRLRVVILERDPSFARASSALSVGNVRVQFSLRENILISRYTLEVLRSFEEVMAVDGSPPGIGFRAEGNLFLVDEAGTAAARASLSLQQELGCSVEWWSPAEIESRFPEYAASGFAGGVFSPDDGHLDCYSLLMGYRRKAGALGARLCHGEASCLKVEDGRISGVELTSGERLECGVVVNCAGAWAADLAQTAGVALPISPVRRQVFVVDPAVKPPSPLPLTALPSGLYFRSEPGATILVGKSLPSDPEGYSMSWDRRRFEDLLWPELASFVPAFDRLRFRRGWAGLYAVNALDGNAVLGEWPELEGFYLANGFSGHGLQQAPAVGRYLAELILGIEPRLDLSIFGPRRLLDNRPLNEDLLV